MIFGLLLLFWTSEYPDLLANLLVLCSAATTVKTESPAEVNYPESSKIRLRDAKNIEAYCTCNTTFEILMKVPNLGSSVALCNVFTGPGSRP
mgnify:CR=1 FL=1